MTMLYSTQGTITFPLAAGNTLVVNNLSGTETVTGSSASREDASGTLGSGRYVYGPQASATTITISTSGQCDYQVVAGDPTPTNLILRAGQNSTGQTVLDDASKAAIAESGISTVRYPGSFKRLSSSPIYSTASEKAGYQLGAIYWPWVFPAYKYIANPLARYYLYYSTDHSTWGGIGLALSDSPTGPFVQYTPSGPPIQDPNCPGTYTNGHANQAGAIYMDAQVGSTGNHVTWGTPGATLTPGTINFNQCETPSVIWDESIGMLRMFYQVGSSNGRAVFSYPADLTATPAYYETFVSSTGNQSTLSAVSTDGINWTKDRNFIIESVWPSHTSGDGHSGYFVPSQVRGEWTAFHLWGSTNYARFAVSRGIDGGSKWQTDNRELGNWTHMCGLSSGGSQMGINWNAVNVIDSVMGPIAIGSISEFVSGSSARESYLCAFPLTSDLRKPLPKIQKFSFLSGQLSWESADLKGVCVMRDQGRTFVYYGCKTTGGVYNVGVMEYV